MGNNRKLWQQPLLPPLLLLLSFLLLPVTSFSTISSRCQCSPTSCHATGLGIGLYCPPLVAAVVPRASSSSSSWPSSSTRIQRSYLASSAVGNAEEGSKQEDDDDATTATSSGSGTATITQEVFNLVKGIVGAGVLTLPAGIAAFANAPSAALPAVALIAVIGVLSGYGFALIGRVCSLTSTTSFRQAWSATVSEKSSWIPAWSVTLKTIFATLAYSMILGDTFSSLLTSAGVQLSKTATLSIVTSTILLPLCLLKNLSSLAPFSLLGSLGMMYTAVAMAIRYFGKAYVPGIGKFAMDLAPNYRPSFGTVGASGVLNPTTSILIGMLSTAYMAHFNAPKFFVELKDNTVKRYTQVVATSFAISIAIFAVIGALGFLTFGANSAGLILNNYSTRDALMSASRVAVAVSILFSYPLAFCGARDGVLDLFQIKNRSTKFLNTLTVGMLSALTVAALNIPDVSFVLAFAGATLGNALIYVYPALMFRGAIKHKKDATESQKTEVKLALTSAALGLGMGIMGAIKAVQSVLK